mgnify:CR=1 FL=1
MDTCRPIGVVSTLGHFRVGHNRHFAGHAAALQRNPRANDRLGREAVVGCVGDERLKCGRGGLYGAGLEM